MDYGSLEYTLMFIEKLYQIAYEECEKIGQNHDFFDVLDMIKVN